MIFMSKLIRVALYTLSSKQGRQAIFSIIVGILCTFLLPIIVISGAASSYLTVFGGEPDDAYVQAVNEIKDKYEIENNLDPALLRAIYYNEHETTEADKTDIIPIIENHFIRSEILPRTVTEEDIAELELHVQETEQQLESIQKEHDDLQKEINKLNQDIEKGRQKISSTKDILDMLNGKPLTNEYLIKFYTDRLNQETEELNQLLDELNNQTAISKKLQENIETQEADISELSKTLQELKDIYASEPKTVYYFLEFEEIKTVLTASPFLYNAELIDEIETLLIVLKNYNSVDFDDITFDNETANDTQKEIVKVAASAADYGIAAVENQCQAWVADIYQKVLGSRGHAPSAIAAGRAWSVSSDWSKIQIGATVYGTSNNQYGHVGIYIGNGIVVHNLDGYVKTQSLESWVQTYSGMCWGWENGKNLTGDPQYNCIGGLI